MKTEQHICYSTPIEPPPAPESKVRRVQLCASHWVQGSPLPPAAQAIISFIEIRGGELFSLILPRFPCYEYTMDVVHQRYPSLNSPVAEPLGCRPTNLRTESFFDGTNPPIVVGLTKNHN